MFRKMPILLLLLIVSTVFMTPYMTLEVKQGFYAVSLTMKHLIVFVLPLIIFALLFKTAVMLSSKATKIIGLILILVCCSNFISTMLSHFLGSWVYSFDLNMIKPNTLSGLAPLWHADIPALISNDKAMFSSIILGIFLPKVYPKQTMNIAKHIEVIIEKILKGTVLIVPLFIVGFIVKLQHDGVIGVIIKDYATIFTIIALAQYGYILLLYFIISKGCVQKFINHVKGMLPAVMCGFSTMSSAASMPLTIMGVETDAKSKDLARSVVPATVNIHLIGDCFAIPIFAYAVLKSFGVAEPSFYSYLIFAFYFMLAKFSVAAIPGGGIIVMLPILDMYLGFSGEMMSLITALYILFDPVITSANIFGNGAFAKIMDMGFSNILNKKSR
ncbi:MAG: transporter [Alphaproteobacteria bacterium CG_4_10_14_0_8_um_filter_37_21]|nr:MAG: transporter [Alphaproteobacteria bacterium CG_4_10_14_0_8_um_filter_37_21]